MVQKREEDVEPIPLSRPISLISHHADVLGSLSIQWLI